MFSDALVLALEIVAFYFLYVRFISLSLSSNSLHAFSQCLVMILSILVCCIVQCSVCIVTYPPFIVLVLESDSVVRPIHFTQRRGQRHPSFYYFIIERIYNIEGSLDHGELHQTSDCLASSVFQRSPGHKFSMTIPFHMFGKGELYPVQYKALYYRSHRP